MGKKIAVCIQVYNEELHLTEAIRSVLTQTFADFDLIISDNYSTDSTPEIISDFQAIDNRIVAWQPDKFCKSLEHARYFIDRVNQLDYESTIFLGGHDVISSRYIELLFAAYQENPNASVVVGSGIEIDSQGNNLREWPLVSQYKGGHVCYRPLSVLLGLYYNLPAFGLWPKRIRQLIKFRHDCTCGDHLYIAEASLHGDVIVEPQALIYTRRTEVDHKTYFNKHISDNMQPVNIVADFEKQLEWVCHINNLAFAGFPEAIKNINLAASVGLYLTRYGIQTLQSVDGALDLWLNSESGRIISAQLSAIGHSIGNESQNS